MNPPAVSVIIPVYNCARYISQALDSVRRQTISDLECIVVNDGSTDRSLEILRRHAATDKRVRVISRENRGLVASLNEAVAASKGRFLARMDGDDLCAPERFEKQLKAFDADPDAVCVGSWVNMVDPGGRRLKTYRPPVSHTAIVSELLNGNGGALIHPSVMLRRDAVEKCGGYRALFAGYGEDWDLYLRLSEVGALHNLPEILLEYRQHAASYNCTRRAAQVETLWKAINQARSARGLEPLQQPAQNAASGGASVRRQWALWALEGGESGAALAHAACAVLFSPTERSAWSLLNYTIRKTLAARHPSASRGGAISDTPAR